MLSSFPLVPNTFLFLVSCKNHLPRRTACSSHSNSRPSSHGRQRRTVHHWILERIPLAHRAPTCAAIITRPLSDHRSCGAAWCGADGEELDSFSAPKQRLGKASSTIRPRKIFAASLTDLESTLDLITGCRF
jgi:hypothetical protein